MYKPKEQLLKALKAVFPSVEISRRSNSEQFYTITIARSEAGVMPETIEWRGPIIKADQFIFQVRLKQVEEPAPMNKWYEIYTLLIDQYNAVLAAHNSGEMDRQKELARLRQIKALHLDLWFVKEGLIGTGGAGEERIVEYAPGEFAYRRQNRLHIAQADVMDGLNIWVLTMIPVYLPSREVQI